MRINGFVLLLSILLPASDLLAAPAAAPNAVPAGTTAVATPVRGYEKFAVFPIAFSDQRGLKVDSQTADSLQEAWWEVREELADTGRFLVATKSFLQKADVFQPRANLASSDAVILGRYVEADALMTMKLEDRVFSMTVWDAAEGIVAWRSSIELHPSILIRDQLTKVGRGLVREFLAAVPYHGITLKDSLARSAVYEDGGKKMVKVQIGSRGAFKAGDEVQWISLDRVSLGALFQGAAKSTVKAEGVILEVKEKLAIVELRRVADLSAIKAGTLVYAPLEKARLDSLQIRQKDVTSSEAVLSLLAAGSPGGQGLEPEGKKVERDQAETGPLATTLSILASLAVILLIAF
ncbi:MAG: hypothetical protein U1E10_10145 [Bdellovibrionales bacterium]|nr:hypothetical protein [Bdellovibrionales bacterium]